MPALSTEALASSLAQGLSPLYVIHGEEPLLAIEAADMIRSAARASGYSERELFTVDTGFNWSAVHEAMNSISLFSALKILEIRIPNAKLGVEGAQTLNRIASSPPAEMVILIVFSKLDRQQQQSKWFQLLSAASQVVYAKNISRQELPAWVAQRLNAQRQRLSEQGMAFFVDCIEGNLLAACQEISKLALLHPEGELDLSQLQETVANVARFDIFRLSECWFAGETARVVRLLEGLEAEGETPALVLWSFTDDIRTLLRLGKGLQQQRPFHVLATELRLWGIKQRLALPALKRIGRRTLMEALELCARIDLQIKGAVSGNPWHLLTTLAVRLAA